jgi:hypothetical protein
MVTRIRDALRFLGVLVTAVVSGRPVRPRGDEATQSLPGDELVADAKVRTLRAPFPKRGCISSRYQWNHAITIHARPADIWPWLVQMGAGAVAGTATTVSITAVSEARSGSFRSSQQIRVGDIFPMTPKVEDTFVVRVVEPERALVLGDAAGGMGWEFVLEPVDEDSTRVIARVRAT